MHLINSNNLQVATTVAASVSSTVASSVGGSVGSSSGLSQGARGSMALITQVQFLAQTGKIGGMLEGGVEEEIGGL